MAFAPMARANSNSSLKHHGLGAITVVKPIFIHPAHCLEFSTPAGDEVDMPDVAQLTMDALPSSPSPSSSVASLPDEGYFWSSSPNSAYSMASSSPSSSASSTPTHESPYTKAPALSRNTSFSFGSPSSPTAPSSPFPAQLSFSAFSPTPSRASSPPRHLPYARPAGASSMVRSVSSPVETQSQLERRTRAIFNATDAVNEQAVKLARTRSAVGLGLATSGGGSVGMSRASSSLRSGCPSPLVSPFGEGWGAALPPREYEAPPLIPFPYSLAHKPVSPHRLVRANSIANPGSSSSPLSPTLPGPSHRNSLPTSHSPFPSSPLAVDAPSSPVMSRNRRGTLTPLTPIFPASPLLPVDEKELDDNVAFRVAVEDFATSPRRHPPTRLQRGMSF